MTAGLTPHVAHDLNLGACRLQWRVYLRKAYRFHRTHMDRDEARAWLAPSVSSRRLV